MNTQRRRNRRAFTLTELLFVIGIIVVILGAATPTITKIFGADADAQAYNLMAALLTSARAYAIRHNVPAGVYVGVAYAQPDHILRRRGSCWAGVVAYDKTRQWMMVPTGYWPRQMPEGMVFGGLDGKFFASDTAFDGAKLGLTDPGEHDKDVGNASDFMCFSVAFSPTGQLVQKVDGRDIKYPTGSGEGTVPWTGPLKDSKKLWAYSRANNANAGGNGEPGVNAMVLFDYSEYMPLDGAGRANYLNNNAQFLVVSPNTGMLAPKR